jgi:hypothetical protein
VKKLIVIVFLLSNNTAFTQNEGNIWYFGIEAGIDFSNELLLVY